MKKPPLSVPVLGLAQAAALAIYISAVGLIMWYSQNWSVKTPGMLGVFFFLTLFTLSALICGLIALGYPAYLFFKQKNPGTALQLIFYTIGWLAAFAAAIALFFFSY
jgi:hypothetical protein